MAEIKIILEGNETPEEINKALKEYLKRTEPDELSGVKSSFMDKIDNAYMELMNGLINHFEIKKSINIDKLWEKLEKATGTVALPTGAVGRPETQVGHISKHSDGKLYIKVSANPTIWKPYTPGGGRTASKIKPEDHGPDAPIDKHHELEGNPNLSPMIKRTKSGEEYMRQGVDPHEDTWENLHHGGKADKGGKTYHELEDQFTGIKAPGELLKEDYVEIGTEKFQHDSHNEKFTSPSGKVIHTWDPEYVKAARDRDNLYYTGEWKDYWLKTDKLSENELNEIVTSNQKLYSELDVMNETCKVQGLKAINMDLGGVTRNKRVVVDNANNQTLIKGQYLKLNDTEKDKLSYDTGFVDDKKKIIAGHNMNIIAFSMPKREVLASNINEKLGLNFVPKTEEIAPNISKSEWIKDSKPVMPAKNSEEYKKLHVFWYLIGQRDGHSGNVLTLADGALKSIDNGLSFTRSIEFTPKEYKSIPNKDAKINIDSDLIQKIISLDVMRMGLPLDEAKALNARRRRIIDLYNTGKLTIKNMYGENE